MTKLKYRLEPEEYLFRIYYVDGMKGGLVSGPKNLSQEGDCWIYENARALGDSRVSENAQLYDKSRISDNAQIKGNTSLSDNSRVGDSAQISGNITVRGDSYIGGRVKLRGKSNIDDIELYGNNIVSRTPIVITSEYYKIIITDNFLNIGCQSHRLAKWESFTKENFPVEDYYDLWRKNKSWLLRVAREHQAKRR